jgi:hypothetical protein
MNQYHFEIIDKKTGRVEHARATAKTDAIARAQIVLMYGSQFTVAGLFSDVRPAHQVVGEIDCSDFPPADTEWLMNQAAMIEGVTP